MNDVSSRVEQIAARAAALYSRPTVALEIVRLTNEPQVDPRLLKELLEKDPALTCKVLRVVNSSFYGLRREVADLNQALTVLGNKPLRLLVLGFSLPDELFAELAAEQLKWYWRTTLTRAVAARQLATELWQEEGDEAFIAGLLQDIGILALLRELGEPYAKLLGGVMRQRSDLAALERDSLGFDHIELSAALMREWHLPQRLVDAVAAPKQVDRLVRTISVDADLARILHLAELLAQLVGQRRFSVLAELLEAGGAYHDLTKGRLAVLVEKLQPQVEQLANVMSVELAGDQNYVDVLTTAHERMSKLSEEFAGQFRQHRSEDEVYTELLHEAQELTIAMKVFLDDKEQCDAVAEPRPKWNQWHAPHERTQGERSAAETTGDSGVGIVALIESIVRGPASVPRTTPGIEPDPGRDKLSQRTGHRRQRRHAALAPHAGAVLPLPRRRRGRALDHGRAARGDPAQLRATASRGAGERGARRFERPGRTRGCVGRGPHGDRERRRGHGGGRVEELRSLASGGERRALSLRRPLVQHQRGEEH